MDPVCVVDARIPTAATDGRSIFVNPHFFETLKPEEQQFVLGHEVWHAAMSHSRREGVRDHELWNVATDIEINRLLQEEFGKDSPASGLYGEKVFKPEVWEQLKTANAERIYAELEKDAAQARRQQQRKGGSTQGGSGQEATSGQGGQDRQQPGQAPSAAGQPGAAQGTDSTPGQGANGAAQPSDPHARGPLSDQHIWGKEGPVLQEGQFGTYDASGRPKMDPRFQPEPMDASSMKNLEEKWKARMIEAGQKYAQRQSGQGRGTLPAGISEVINALGKTKINWRRKLQRSTAIMVSGASYDWRVLNRRQLLAHTGDPEGDHYQPARRSPMLVLNVALDTSGSVGSDSIGRFLTNIKTIVDNFPKYKLRIYQCDAEVAQVKEYSDAGDLFTGKGHEIAGRGGTAFSPVLRQITEEMRSGLVLPRTPLIYFTDGDGDSPAKPAFPVIWAIVGKDQCSAQFGEKINIDFDEA
jgi:predicted metal-dependent peptidase